VAIERTVHIVDDDAAVRRSLERLLRAAGFAAVSYSTPFAFLDAAPGLSGGCVLLDVRMPGIDGLQVQERLQTSGIRVPVIVLTGEGDVQTAVRAMKAGAFDFLEKPFGDDRLVASIEAALAESGRSDRALDAADAAERIAALTPRERRC
jgi:two-component system response regulator FixJ